MWNKILQTDDDWSATVLRVTLGIAIFPHGAQKLFGWFGGAGLGPALDFFQSLGIPTALGLLVILGETLGAVALVFGLGGRVMAAAIGAIMVGAVATVHLQNGFFMNWYGAQGGEGFEYHLLAFALASAVAIKGSGALSIDRALTNGAGGPSTT